MADPILLANDNWWTGSGATETAARAALQGAFPLTTGGTDAATVADLAPGAYTMVMRSALPENRGVALAEVYGQHLLNISTRGTVGAGDNVLIAGFTIDTPEPLSVLVRAIGPTLTSYGVGGALANPTLTVYRQLPNGETRIEVARRAVKGVAALVPANARIGLRMYGAQSASAEKVRR